MREDILDALRTDPGSRTFGQLAQERQSALLEILRLRRELETVAWKQPAGADKARSAARVADPPVLAHAQKAAPAGSLLRLKDVSAMLGVSRSTVYKRMRDGSFPQPVVLGPRAVRWRSEVVDAWRDRLQERSDSSASELPRGRGRPRYGAQP
jgi:prophage regulatory protein